MDGVNKTEMKIVKYAATDSASESDKLDSFSGRYIAPVFTDKEYFTVFSLLTVTGVTGALLGAQKGCAKIGGLGGLTIGVLCGIIGNHSPHLAFGTSLLATAKYISMLQGVPHHQNLKMDKLTQVVICASSALCFYTALFNRHRRPSHGS